MDTLDQLMTGCPLHSQVLHCMQKEGRHFVLTTTWSFFEDIFSLLFAAKVEEMWLSLQNHELITSVVQNKKEPFQGAILYRDISQFSY